MKAVMLYALMASSLLGLAITPTATGQTNAPTELQRLTHKDITLTISASPSTVEFDRTLLLTLTLTAPERIQLDPPNLNDRLSGLRLDSTYEPAPHLEDGFRVRRFKYRLIPIIAKEYRLAPFPITYRDSQASPTEGWFASKPLLFKTTAPLRADQSIDLGGMTEPVWISPDKLTIALYALLSIALILAIVGVIKLCRHLSRKSSARKQDPRVTALNDLQQLLDQNFIQAGDFRQFYFSLTMIVRCYIEDAHHVRAPEQTTEEFLRAVSADKRFDQQIVGRLKDFLQAADMVKYAAQTPSAEMVEGSVSSARQYIAQDDIRALQESTHA